MTLGCYENSEVSPLYWGRNFKFLLHPKLISCHTLPEALTIIEIPGQFKLDSLEAKREPLC